MASKLAAPVLPLARKSSLSACDAAHLTVALCHGPPLETLDNNLEEAGRKAGLEILG